MPVTVKDIADMFGKDVFTARGFFMGKVSDVEVDLNRYKVRSLVIEATKSSMLGKMVGGKKGVIVPYAVVQAIGDIVLIKHVLSAEQPMEEAAGAETVEA